ncbi:MAG: fibronectin type III domain-containing protein, partial [Propionicimonas sp.]|nr:fibronectin type III domain-containing protein [Propionicimonas sp.]
MTRARYAWKPVAWIALWALLVSMLTFVATPAHAAETPTGLKVVNTSARGFAVTWKAVSGAVGYRVKISKNSSMTSADSIKVDTNYAELTRIKTTRLNPGTAYYVQIRVLNADSSDDSKYSDRLKVTTKSAKSLPELSPSFLKGTPASGSALYLSWTSQGPGMLYRVRYGTNPSLTDTNSTTKVFTAAGGTLTGLKASTTYYFKVRALDADKSNLSSYSPVASAKTATAKAVPGLVVASYNVLKPPNWEKRRKALVANIKAQAPDILGIQEATPAKVKSAKNGKSVKQHDDLL